MKQNAVLWLLGGGELVAVLLPFSPVLSQETLWRLLFINSASGAHALIYPVTAVRPQ